MLAQTAVDGKTNEIAALAPLLAWLDLAEAVVTADALHTHHCARELGDILRGKRSRAPALADGYPAGEADRLARRI